MMRLSLVFSALILTFACGVKKAPSPLIEVPQEAGGRYAPEVSRRKKLVGEAFSAPTSQPSPMQTSAK